MLPQTIALIISIHLSSCSILNRFDVIVPYFNHHYTVTQGRLGVNAKDGRRDHESPRLTVMVFDLPEFASRT